jgi:hypothetical protein
MTSRPPRQIELTVSTRVIDIADFVDANVVVCPHKPRGRA